MEPVLAATTDAAGRATRPTRRMGSVVFDCDSTLSAIEGIEYLATGHAAEIEALTRAAMDGELPLEAVYGRRLDLVRPDLAALDRLTRAYIDELTPDVRQVVAALQSESVRVGVISGGLLPAVAAVARELGVSAGDVAAVDVRLDTDGAYAGYDSESPLARSGGKCEILRAWRGKMPHPMMMVGDGATDAETMEVVESFVAYAGVVQRPAVVAVADHVVRSRSLAPILPLALSFEPPRAAEFTELYRKGLALLEADAAPDTLPEPRSQRV